MHNLHDVLVDGLCDLYHAEKQLIRALPRMAEAARSPELRNAFEEHLVETETHVGRLETIFRELDMPPLAKPCRGMEGIIAEGKEVLDEKIISAAADAALIGAAQKVEHYEISAYGTCRAHAEVLGLPRVAQLLQETLDEESIANTRLTQIAQSGVNAAALAGASVDAAGNAEA